MICQFSGALRTRFAFRKGLQVRQFTVQPVYSGRRRMLYDALTDLQKVHAPLTHQEQHFLKEYTPPVRGGAEDDESV